MSGYLIFGGIDSRDYDVFVSFSDIDTVPRRVYTKVDIVGKNGSVLIDEGKYEDVPHSYDCIVLDNEKRVAFVNAIMSKKGYQRLTDSYGTDEYYIAVLEENIEQKTTRIRDKYKFKLVFTRKPQRFLTSGEEPVDTSELGGEVTTDKIPYLFRRSGGGNIGHDFDAEIDKIIGGTVAWNQTYPPHTNKYVMSGSLSGVTISFSDGIATISGTATADCSVAILPDARDTPANHVCLLLKDGGNGIKWFRNGFSTSTVTTNDYLIHKYNSNWSSDALIRIENGVTYNTSVRFSAIDLTALFGSAEIADYVYSLEQTTEGSGIAWLKSYGFLTKDYYPYDPGSTVSVKTTAHRTVGFNQFDKSTAVLNKIIAASLGEVERNGMAHSDYIPVLPNTTYCANYSGNVSVWDVCYYDANKDYIGRSASGGERSGYSVGATPSNCYYAIINISMSELDTACYNLSSSRNGEYAPYEVHSYQLDPDLELRGRFKLDADNRLYAEGDIYPPSGEVSRAYSIVNLGNFTWSFNATYNVGYIESLVGKANGRTNIISDVAVTVDKAYQDMDYGEIAGTPQGRGLNVKLSGATDLNSFTSLVRGHYLVFELETPTTEQADPYASPQIVNPLGTEEYIDTRDVPVPAGHETKYGMSQLVLSNPTDFPSKPLLEVTGVGTFWLGDTLFTITGTAGQTIYIDCETGESWKNVGGIITSANGLVTLNRLDFPELDPGDTPVMYGTGITKVVVTPRWWRL